MVWHYQLMKHTDEEGETWYAVHELYSRESPDKDSDDVNLGWTAEPVDIRGDTLEDIMRLLKDVQSDIRRYGIKDY